MALDRYIFFDNSKPTVEELKYITEDYFSGLGEIDFSKEKQQKTWYVSFAGKPSFPFRRVISSNLDKILNSERWLEIYFGSLDNHSIDVITRMADHITNDIAKGFVKMIARYYKARLEPDNE